VDPVEAAEINDLPALLDGRSFERHAGLPLIIKSPIASTSSRRA